MPKAAHSLPLFRGTNNRKLMGWVKKREISHCQKQLRLSMGKINLKYYYQIFYSNPFLTHPLPTSLGNNKKKINSFLGAYAQLHAWSRNLCQNGYFQNTFLHLQDTLKTKEKEISDCKFFLSFSLHSFEVKAEWYIDRRFFIVLFTYFWLMLQYNKLLRFFQDKLKNLF